MEISQIEYDKKFFEKLIWSKTHDEWIASFVVGEFHIRIIAGFRNDLIDQSIIELSHPSSLKNRFKLTDLENFTVQILARHGSGRKAFPKGIVDIYNYLQNLSFKECFKYSNEINEARINLDELIELCNLLKIKSKTISLMA